MRLCKDKTEGRPADVFILCSEQKVEKRVRADGILFVAL
jgi:hypothetical protein